MQWGLLSSRRVFPDEYLLHASMGEMICTECVGGRLGRVWTVLKMQWGCSAALMAILVYVCCFSYRLLRPSPSKFIKVHVC